MNKKLRTTRIQERSADLAANICHPHGNNDHNNTTSEFAEIL